MSGPAGQPAGSKAPDDYGFELLQVSSPTHARGLEPKAQAWMDLMEADAADELQEPGARGAPRHRWHNLRSVGVGALALALLATAGLVLGRHSMFFSRARHMTSLWQSSRFLRLPDGVCADEWQPITNDLACQAAAKELGLPAPQLPLRRYTKRPTGCYFVPGTGGASGTLWMNTYSDNVGQVFDTAAGWVPQTLCARRGVGGTTPPPTTTAPVAPPQTVCQYVVGIDGHGTCPPSSVPLKESECREMPYHFGGMLHVPFMVDSPMDPHGCFFFRAHYYFNRNYGGMGRPQRKVYCKKCQTVPALTQHMGDWSEWGSDSPQTLALTRSASSRFRKISVGRCSDIHWHPIQEKAACEEAAKYLALTDIEASVTNYAERPEGCYYFRNYADGTETLWVDVNPWSRGKGAETSDLAAGGLRQPICSRQPTAGTASSVGGFAADRNMMGGTFTDHSKTYRKISMGRCMDNNWLPIMEPARCTAAATALGLADGQPQITSIADRPEGCYYFKNTEDLSVTLWLNTSPLSRGNGAQATDSAPKGFREPLCANPATVQ